MRSIGQTGEESCCRLFFVASSTACAIQHCPFRPRLRALCGEFQYLSDSTLLLFSFSPIRSQPISARYPFSFASLFIVALGERLLIAADGATALLRPMLGEIVTEYFRIMNEVENESVLNALQVSGFQSDRLCADWADTGALRGRVFGPSNTTSREIAC